MDKLVANAPDFTSLPLEIGAAKLTGVDLGSLTSVTLSQGQKAVASADLKAKFGMNFPAANRTAGKDDARCIWFGLDSALLVGPRPKPIKGASLTDQSDGWAALELSGDGSEAVLARLVPVDVRASVFKRGHTVRTLLFHAPLSLTRTKTDTFLLLVFRSMTKTAIHELSVAMETIKARQISD